MNESVSAIADTSMPTRESHCSCGRPARQVLDGGKFGPTGYCGAPLRPLDPCDCGQGAERHDRSVCHVYGRGLGLGILNMTLGRGDEAPYWTPCPSWCLDRRHGHDIELHDDDRYHFGDLYYLPIRDLGITANGDDSYTLGHTEMYLRHYTIKVAPEIRVDLNGSSVGVSLTISEAEQIGRALLSMVQSVIEVAL